MHLNFGHHGTRDSTIAHIDFYEMSPSFGIKLTKKDFKHEIEKEKEYDSFLFDS